MFIAAGVLALGGTGVLRNVKYHLGMWDYTYTRVHEAADTKKVDVLFLGSSHCYRTFDPRQYEVCGLRTFNLGSSNQTPMQTLMFLRLYLDSLAPRLVVIEVHPDGFWNDGVESSVHLANNMLPSVPMARMAFSMRNVKSLLSMFYSAFRNGLCSDYERFEECTYDDENRYVSGGFVERIGGCYKSEPHQPKEIVVREENLRTLRRCVALLSERGIPCLLVETPGTHDLMDSYRGHSRFEELMGEEAPYVPPMTEGLVDTLHFCDGDHRDLRGVELFNARFRDSVLIPFMKEKHLI